MTWCPISKFGEQWCTSIRENDKNMVMHPNPIALFIYFIDNWLCLEFWKV